MSGSTAGAGTEPAGIGPAGIGLYTSTALERGTFQWGGVVYPVTPATTNGALHDLDPSVYYAIAYWTAVLGKYLGERWSAECTAAGRADIASTIVKSSIGFDPDGYLTQYQAGFPLLAVYRTGETVADHTVVWERTDATWSVDWILPPLTVAQAQRLTPFLPAVAHALVDRTTEATDSIYAAPWQAAGLQEIGITAARYGYWQQTETLRFPCVHATALVRERRMPVSGGFDQFAGVDMRIDSANPDGSVYQHIADFKT